MTSPLSRHARRGRLGGLAVMVRHGSPHFKALSAAGRSKLDERIAREAGIPDGLEPREYEARLAAARSAHFLRLAELRWKAPRPTRIDRGKAS